MKTLFLSALLFCIAFASQASPGPAIVVSISGFALDNGGTYTYPFPINQGTTQTFTYTITNNGGADLNLTSVNSHYITLSGSALSQVTLDESNVVTPIAAGNSVTFSVTATTNSSTTPGDYSLKLEIDSDDPTNGTYQGTVNYTIAAATTNSVMNASEVGLSLFPNPSSDGKINIKGSETVSKIIVFGTNGMKEEINGENTAFYTKQKGVLLVHLYTAKGIVYDKIFVQ